MLPRRRRRATSTPMRPTRWRAHRALPSPIALAGAVPRSAGPAECRSPSRCGRRQRAGRRPRSRSRYFALIAAGNYGQAWALWDDDGRASGMTRRQFADSFAKYAEYHAEVGAPGRVDAGRRAALRRGPGPRLWHACRWRRAVRDARQRDAAPHRRYRRRDRRHNGAGASAIRRCVRVRQSGRRWRRRTPSLRLTVVPARRGSAAR